MILLARHRDFFPVILNFLRQLPFVGTFLSLPYIRGVSAYFPCDRPCDELIELRLSDGRPGGRREAECRLRWIHASGSPKVKIENVSHMPRPNMPENETCRIVAIRLVQRFSIELCRMTAKR